MADVCAPEPIYGLLRVADDKQFALLWDYLIPAPRSVLVGQAFRNILSEEHCYFGLNWICVLGFVYQQWVYRFLK